MCGIAGIYAYLYSAPPPSARELTAISERLASRGPDGHGEWATEDRRCLLAHRRLSIIDLDERASQPMLGTDASLTITYNGEIYNYLALKRDLEAKGYEFRTTSDTEVILNMYREFGERMLPMLRGMFAFGIWDERRNGLFLARDLYGIKPLYYSDDGWTIRFASQVKGILAGQATSRDMDPAGVVGFLLFGAVPDPFTVYRDIRALPPGTSLWVDDAGVREPRPYRTVAGILADGRSSTPISRQEIDQRVRDATLDSVRHHLIADVEVGAFLSAGVDSGALLGLMRDAGQFEIQTLTLGFADFRGTIEDETPIAEAVAGRYGSRHTTRWVSEKEFREELPKILDAMDQPSIDGINSWFVSKAAHELGLKVAISGVGGDELLGGYPSFVDIPRWTSWLRGFSLFAGLGATVRSGLRTLRPQLSPKHTKALGLLELGGSYPGAYLIRRSVYLPFELGEQFDPDMVREGIRRLKPLRGIGESLQPDPGSPMARVCALESANYMRNQLLRDTDWAGMAHSLEIRTPLVDSILLQNLAPIFGSLRPGEGKQSLARAPSRPLPREVSERAKTGFSVPTGIWTSGALASRGPGLNVQLTKGEASRAWASQVLEHSFPDVTAAEGVAAA